MKLLLFTDIHYGLKNNATEYNEYCHSFIDFIVENVQSEGIDEICFLGDWTHDRNKINLQTLKYSYEGLLKLNKLNKPVSIIVGNHDMYYRNNRDIHSMPFLTELNNVTLVDSPTMLGSYRGLFIPYLVEGESFKDMIEEHNPDYVFCHPEFPSFMLNKKVKMDGEFNPETYKGPKRICCGHFHIRQEKSNVTYIGNCFSHDFSDNNEWANKGIAILDTDTNEIIYKEWTNAPKYLIRKMSTLTQEELLLNNLTLRIINDTNLTALQVSELQEQLSALPNIKNIMIYPSELECNISETAEEEIELLDYSTLIVSLLSTVEMDNIDSQSLIQEYMELE